MTERYAYLRKTHKAQGARLRKLAYAYMSLFIIILFFKNSDAAAEWVLSGLYLCAKKLVPSLFPFMVISSIAVSSGLGRLVARIAGKPVKLLFGLGKECSCALILGWLCGFPLGAKCASELYDKKKINIEEYKRVLCICSTPSPAFLISAVGGAMLGNKKYGIWLYAISLISAIIVGVILKIKQPIICRSDSDTLDKEERISFARCITSAVSDSALGMISVCAFVIFFSAFLGTLEAALSFLCLPTVVHTLIFCVFELTSGLSKICSLNSDNIFSLCAFAVGWSGLSVHFQTMSICGSKKDTHVFNGYILSHAVRAAICMLLGFFIDKLIL